MTFDPMTVNKNPLYGGYFFINHNMLCFLQHFTTSLNCRFPLFLNKFYRFAGKADLRKTTTAIFQRGSC